MQTPVRRLTDNALRVGTLHIQCARDGEAVLTGAVRAGAASASREAVGGVDAFEPTLLEQEEGSQSLVHDRRRELSETGGLTTSERAGSLALGAAHVRLLGRSRSVNLLTGTVAPLAELAGRTVMTTRARPRTLRGAKNADAAAVDHVRCDAVAGEGAVAVRGQGVRRKARADRQALAGGAVGVESAVADANALAGSARRRGIRVGALADVRAKSVRRIQDGTDVSTRTVGQACSEPPMVMMGSIARALTQAQMRTRPRRLVLTPTVAS